MLVVMMMNYTTHFIHPLDSRRRVTPKEVLLYVVAKMAKNPALYEIQTTFGMFLQSMSS